MASKEFAVLNIKTSDADEAQKLRQRIDNAEKMALSKGINLSNKKELLVFLLDQLEADNNDKQTPRESNISDIHRLINAQIELNKKDTATATMKDGSTVFINKRRITSAWIQKTLGCSFGAIAAVIGSSKIQSPDITEFNERLEKHYKACGIDETHNNRQGKAVKGLANGNATLNGELIDVKAMAGIA